MPPFKDEHILIIAPGSETTLAQLGLPESFTPARWRFPTRMFPGQQDGEWEPHKIRTKSTQITNGVNGVHSISQDVEMPDAGSAGKPVTDNQPNGDQTIESYEEDYESTEGAVYPMQDGYVVNFTCFFALLSHIYNTLSPPFHTPVLVVSQPAWSARDKELITRFFFEVFNIPALAFMDSAVAACFAYGVQSGIVVDIGQGKCDVTAVSDFIVQNRGRGAAVTAGGGEAMTQRLLESLGSQAFDRSMCEQLKKNPICEILASNTEIPKSAPSNPNPAAAASTGAASSGPGAKEADGNAPGQAPRGPGEGTEVGEEGNGPEDDNEGVLDVASIVAKGNASEYLAKREKDKKERLAAKKGGNVTDAPHPARLKNSEKERATFEVEEIIQSGDDIADGVTPTKRKRNVEVGTERFNAGEAPKDSIYGVIDIIVATIHKVVLSVLEVPKRAELWESLIILGNGSKTRGLKEALLATLSAKYVLSPSNTTIFTSELPSNLSTPLPTGGTNTPLGQPTHPMHHPAAHGVNPLLVAATHANQNPQTQTQPQNQSLQVPGADLNQSHQHSHRGYNQTPTSFKTVKVPEYLPEWKTPDVSGMEEATFLGAQVGAKVVFVVDQGLSKGFLTRSDYNELGPTAIHDCSLE